jgi:hypothetical protein
VEGVADRPKSAAAIPAPVNATDCGDPAALSVSATEPVNEPATFGKRVTPTVQLAPGATGVVVEHDPPLYVNAAPPNTAMFVMFNTPMPALLTVTYLIPLWHADTDISEVQGRRRERDDGSDTHPCDGEGLHREVDAGARSAVGLEHLEARGSGVALGGSGREVNGDSAAPPGGIGELHEPR